MPGVTPVFRWPFQSLPDPPDGPNLGEDLAMAIENTMQGLLTRVVQLETTSLATQATLATLPYRDRQTVTVTPTASVSFINIPSTLRSVEIRWTGRFNANGAVGLQYRINSDAGANYNFNEAGTNDAAYAAVVNTAGANQGELGVIGGNNVAGEFGGGFIVFTGWDAPHTSRLYCGWLSGQRVNANNFSRFGFSIYTGAGPYTRIDIFPAAPQQFEAGSSFELIGNTA